MSAILRDALERAERASARCEVPRCPGPDAKYAPTRTCDTCRTTQLLRQADRATVTRRARKRDEEFAGFARKVVGHLGRHAGQADPDMLAQMLALRDHLDGEMGQVAASLRLAGYTWQGIADELTMAGRKMTRQAVQQRWGHLVPDAEREEQDHR